MIDFYLAVHRQSIDECHQWWNLSTMEGQGPTILPGCSSIGVDQESLRVLYSIAFPICAVDREYDVQSSRVGGHSSKLT